MYITDDPLYDFTRYDIENQKWLNSRPVCHGCGEHIADENAFMLMDRPYHEDCWEAAVLDLKYECLVKVENLMEE